jgi:hypothetical protein
VRRRVVCTFIMNQLVIQLSEQRKVAFGSKRVLHPRCTPESCQSPPMRLQPSSRPPLRRCHRNASWPPLRASRWRTVPGGTTTALVGTAYSSASQHGVSRNIDFCSWPLVNDAGSTQRGLARALAEQGGASDVGRAREFARAARTDAERFGVALLAERVRALEASLG